MNSVIQPLLFLPYTIFPRVLRPNSFSFIKKINKTHKTQPFPRISLSNFTKPCFIYCISRITHWKNFPNNRQLFNPPENQTFAKILGHLTIKFIQSPDAFSKYTFYSLRINHSKESTGAVKSIRKVPSFQTPIIKGFHDSCFSKR